MNRQQLGLLVAQRLRADASELTRQWHASGTIRHVTVDGLLPETTARAIYDAFPSFDRMVRNVSLRESKSIAVQMDRYDPLTEEALYAFQQPEVVELVGRITGLPGLEPDPNLYVGGLSAMRKHDFLNLHIDNSHDKNRARWRVLNLLYYVTPDWSAEDGGSLELWPQGRRGAPVVIPSRFNRLVIMETHQGSWHSVSPIRRDGTRTCVSNYYFSATPARDSDRFHVTFFRGRPEQPLRDLILLADGYARMAIRKVFRLGIRENPHVYKR
ncbi:2OG-Fe(II) oxygenase [Sinimarinibacterium thermocellulolyticum]|uniref:2OG-Fe(II) oxygenase n=1 Tax=Sinimarinibacterium thermocellulolyticum TaxID=3170016 RepID=A0ABV2A9N9_9GAMM